MTLGLDVKILTDISIEPVTTSELKSYLNIDYTSWDVLLGNLISSSRIRLERYTGCSFGSKVLVATFMQTANEIEIPYGPVQSIEYVKAINDDGTKTTLTLGTDYIVIGNLFKTIRFYETGKPIEIQYTAGYTSLPVDLKVCILKQAALDFEYREGTSDAKMQELSNSAMKSAKPYRRVLMF